MGYNYEIWRETGQLASCCTSVYSFLSIWFPNSLNICKILFSEISDTNIISFSVLMKVLEIYDKKILQIFYESVNQIKRKLKIEVRQEASWPVFRQIS